MQIPQMGFGKGGEKAQQTFPVRLLMEPATRALQVPSLLPKKLKLKVTLLYPTHKVSVRVSRRTVVDMAFKPTSKVVIPPEMY